jgi:hypothetical protein
MPYKRNIQPGLVFLSFLFLLSSCSFMNRLELMVNPKEAEENKILWYQEVRSVEPTSNIHYIDGYAKNQYLPTITDFIDTFANDRNIIFASFTKGQFFTDWILLARLINSTYVISLTEISHGDVEFKGFAEFSRNDFLKMLDSTNIIIKEKNHYLGEAIYLDTILYKECSDEVKENHYLMDLEVDNVHPQITPSNSNNNSREVYNNVCFSNQVFGVFINNIDKSLFYFNYYDEDAQKKNPKNKFAQLSSQKLLGIINRIKWTQTY